MTEPSNLSVEARRRGLRAIIVSGVAAKSADYVLGLLTPFLVLASGGDAAGALFIVALRGVPYLVSPLLGAAIDAFDRRAVYILSQLGQAACLAVVFLFHDHLVVVGIAMMLSGLGAVTSSTTSQFVILPLLSVAENRGKLISRYSAAIEIAKVVGLLTAAAISSLTEPVYGIGLVALAYALAGGVATLLPALPKPEHNRPPFSDLLVGFRWLRKADVGFLVSAEMLFNLGMGALATTLVIVLAEEGLGPSVVAVAFAASLLAGALGSFVAPHVFPRARLAVRLLVADVIAVAAFIVIVLSRDVVILILAFTVHSVALGISNVIAIEFRQSTIPLELAGRVNSVMRMAITGAVPLSGMVYAAATDAGLWIWLPGVILAAASLVVWSFYTVRVDRPGLQHVE